MEGLFYVNEESRVETMEWYGGRKGCRVNEKEY